MSANSPNISFVHLAIWMRITFMLFCPGLVGCLSCRCQYYYYNDKYYNTDWVIEFGGSGGAMNSLTDIGGRKGTGSKFIKDLNWKVTKPAFGIYAVATYKDAFGIRLEGGFGSIHSYDSILKNVATTTYGRYERNLSFRTDIKELHLTAELHPLFFKSYEDREVPRLSPYTIAGIGLFSFNPQGYLNGHWYYLHPLCTEGQGFKEYPGRKPYKLTQLDVPMGLGLRYEMGPFAFARLEFVYRVLFTDYLDDASQVEYIDPDLFINYLPRSRANIAQQLYDQRISPLKNNQRGDPKNNDAFFTIQLKLGITLRSASTKRQ